MKYKFTFGSDFKQTILLEYINKSEVEGKNANVYAKTRDRKIDT